MESMSILNLNLAMLLESYTPASQERAHSYFMFSELISQIITCHLLFFSGNKSRKITLQIFVCDCENYMDFFLNDSIHFLESHFGYIK